MEDHEIILSSRQVDT